MKNFTGNFLILILLNIHIAYTLPANDSKKEKEFSRIDNRVTEPYQSIMNINNITCWMDEKGFHDWFVGGSWNGSFPIDYYIGTIFSEGIVWGGKVNDGIYPQIRVNGNTYSSGCAPVTRIYRVRSDYQTADLTMDAATFFNISPGEVTQVEINEIYTQYQADWNEWPMVEGAPFKDVNGNGIYDASVDTPGVPSASQTIFIKYDDSNSSIIYGSPPIGLEVSEIYWSFSGVPALNNIIFKMVNLIYTGVAQSLSTSYIDSMYVCQWADPDIGNFGDDFAGCDTTLNLGYAYNAGQIDDIYQSIGYEPPATGYEILQGVAKFTGNSADSAIINFHWRHGYKYSCMNPMSSFIYFAAYGAWIDPAFTYTGTLEFYNLMRGYLPDPPYPSTVPFPSSVADYTGSGCFLLTGDPVSGIGKIDGILDGQGDRRILPVHGPFHMNLSDTVQIVTALITASGSDYLESITELRKEAFSADSAFQTYVDPDYISAVDTKMPDNFNYRLSQNYPNPFNPATTISWQSPVSGVQTLKVFDMLGREVATLVNVYKPAGRYEIKFDNSQLSSGVYFYQLKAGSFIETKKMILLK